MPVDHAGLEAQVAEIQRTRIVYDRGEHLKDVRCVSAPIRSEGRIVVALAVLPLPLRAYRARACSPLMSRQWSMREARKALPVVRLCEKRGPLADEMPFAAMLATRPEPDGGQRAGRVSQILVWLVLEPCRECSARL